MAEATGVMMALMVTLEEGDLGDVADLARVLILVQLQVLKVFLQRMAHYNFVVEDFLQL